MLIAPTDPKVHPVKVVFGNDVELFFMTAVLVVVVGVESQLYFES